MSRRHLILRLEAPLMSFGGVTIDNYGVTRDFPARSMIAGLIGSALGYERTQPNELQRLQNRIVFAVRREREPYIGVLQDNQNAKLEKNDKGWTTRGTVEERGGGADTYKSPHRRFRDYHPDALLIIALRLDPAADSPDLDAVATALDSPQHPLFIGRKPCLPSGPLVMREDGAPLFRTAETAGEALLQVPSQEPEDERLMRLRAQWPEGEGPQSVAPHAAHSVDLCDERNWRSGLHGGSRRIVEAQIEPLSAKEAS